MDNSITKFIDFESGGGPKRANAWYKKWRERIHAWVERRADSDWADILLLLPDLFMLAVGTMKDSRIPLEIRNAFLLAVLYVLSPLDLIPEALLGVAGLVDDAGILIILFNLLFTSLNIEPDVLEQIPQDHWLGDEDPVVTVGKLLAKLKAIAGKLFERLSSIVMGWLRRGSDGGDAGSGTELVPIHPVRPSFPGAAAAAAEPTGN